MFTYEEGKHFLTLPNDKNLFGLNCLFTVNGFVEGGDTRDAWFPFIEPSQLNGPEPSHPHWREHFDSVTNAFFEKEVLSMEDNLNSYLEVGMSRFLSGDPGIEQLTGTSSTEIINRLKKKSCTYIGIDINEHFLSVKSPEENRHVYLGDSGNKSFIDNIMKERGLTELDFIFLDGWHSVGKILEEWEWVTQYLRVGGIVGFHDICYHPGPHLLWRALNETCFEKRELNYHWGIGFATRLRK